MGSRDSAEMFKSFGKTRQCPGQELNLHALAGATTSRQCVCRFGHLDGGPRGGGGIKQRGGRTTTRAPGAAPVMECVFYFRHLVGGPGGGGGSIRRGRRKASFPPGAAADEPVSPRMRARGRRDACPTVNIAFTGSFRYRSGRARSCASGD